MLIDTKVDTGTPDPNSASPSTAAAAGQKQTAAQAGQQGTQSQAAQAQGAQSQGAGAQQQSGQQQQNAGDKAKAQDGKKDEGSLLGGDGEQSDAQEGAAKAGEKKDEGKQQGEDKAPEQYEAFKVPEGMTLDQKALETFTPVAKELDLSQAKAQKLVDLYAGQMRAAAEQQEIALLEQRKNWRTEIKKDPKWQETVSLAKKAVDRFGDETFKAMQKSWMGDHPSVIRFLANVEKAMGDDRFVEGGGRGGKESLSRAEKMYGKQQQK